MLMVVVSYLFILLLAVACVYLPWLVVTNVANFQTFALFVAGVIVAGSMLWSMVPAPGQVCCTWVAAGARVAPMSVCEARPHRWRVAGTLPREVYLIGEPNAWVIDQYYERDEEARHNGQATSFSLIQNRVTPTDSLDFAPGFVIIGNTNQTSAQNYFSSNSTGHCYSRIITADTGVLTSITDGQGCN
jgi:hypothetical protein